MAGQMLKLKSSAIGIDQGDLILFSDYQHDGLMWTGEGPRQIRAYVQFASPFQSPPSVNLGLTMWDVSNAANARADVQAEEITALGFAILFKTWGDTRIARVRVGWQAIGPVSDDEDWDVV